MLAQFPYPGAHDHAGNLVIESQGFQVAVLADDAAAIALKIGMLEKGYAAATVIAAVKVAPMRCGR